MTNNVLAGIIQFVSDSGVVSSFEDMPLLDLELHAKAQREIIDSFLVFARSTDLKIPKPPANSLVDLKFYETVFALPDSEFLVDDTAGACFEAVDTEYGRGCKLVKLDPVVLNSCKPDSEGFIHMIVGTAFRNNALTGCEPFTASLNNQGKKHANKVSSGFKKAGYDCVQIKDKVNEKVYWVPGACIPLAKVTMRVHEYQPCIICFDNCLTKDGYACSQKHFLCWECFEYQVNDALKPDYEGKTVNQDGELICSDTECTETILLENVARESTPVKIIKLLEELKLTLQIKKAVEAALTEQQTRLNKEFERIMAIKDLDERESEKIRIDIIENILTLRCPRCKMAFIDYDGCAAITCTCRAEFCACCLMDCEGDAHRHVVRCPLNPSHDVFVSFDEFERIHRERQQRAIEDRLRKESRAVQQRLLARMKKEFQDLRIIITI
jgi:hypothetical protein